MKNVIAIVGRPNVGKSTLFNRLIHRQEAIVEPSSGVTRDRHYGYSHWNGKEFSVVDTGGYVEGSDDIFEKAIRQQLEYALSEAELIIFMVDGRSGLTDFDRDVFKFLRRSNKKIFVAVNKIDSGKNFYDTAEFYELGVEQLFPISAINGGGTGELLDELVQHLSDVKVDDYSDIPRLSVVGRPNAGKSSLINLLIGEERNIVTPIPGTTRNALNANYKGYGKEFVFIDTAGLRKKSKVKENIEFFSSVRTIRTIEDSDVSILMVDAQRGFEAQDMSIFSLIVRNHKGVVIVVNKWDLVEKDNTTMKNYQKAIQNKIAPFNDVPVVFTSIPEKQRIVKLMDLAVKVFDNRHKKVSGSELNKIILPKLKDNPPPMYKGKTIRPKYISQLPTPYPAFAVFCNLPQYVKEPYKRFVENKIRENFDFFGVPVEIFFRKK